MQKQRNGSLFLFSVLSHTKQMGIEPH
jgi:hypothetical protein